MPAEPDFQQKQTKHMQLVIPCFKEYGIKRTPCDEHGKHKKQRLEMLRTQLKAMPQTQVDVAWQRYRQATGAQRSNDVVTSVSYDRQRRTSAAGDEQQNSSAAATTIADVVVTTLSATGNVPKNNEDDKIADPLSSFADALDAAQQMFRNYQRLSETQKKRKREKNPRAREQIATLHNNEKVRQQMTTPTLPPTCEVIRNLGEGIANHRLDVEKKLRYEATMETLTIDIAALDPTQRKAVDIIIDWAKRRRQYNAKSQMGNSLSQGRKPPHLNMFLSGAAGTGKTRTAQTAILQARLLLGGHHKVLVVAHAAANLGKNATTIDSVFRTNAKGAAEDLEGNQLDELVARLKDVELIVIDEINTVGAAQFEIMHRRMVQVAKHTWQDGASSMRQRKNVPHFGCFGDRGVLCMGDFAQMRPLVATTLLPGNEVEDGKASRLRGIDLTGRARFAGFTTHIRLRRIHRRQNTRDEQTC